MTPLALLLAALFGAPGAAQTPPADVDQEIKQRVSAYVQALCKQSPDSCDTAKLAQAGYEDLLEKTMACEKSSCAADKIARLAKDVAALDDETGKLPDVKDQTENTLLRASALCTNRLSAANAHLKIKTPLPWASDDDTAAEKGVEQLCLNLKEKCKNARAALEGARALRGEISACEAAACGYEKLDALVLKADERAKKAPVFTLYRFANGMLSKALNLLAKLAEGKLDQVDQDAARMEGTISAAEKDRSLDVSSLSRDGAAALSRWQEAAYAADRVSVHLGYPKSQRARVNTAATTLSGLRARALAVATARGLKLDPDGSALVPAGSLGPGAKAKLNAAGLVPQNGPWTPTLLDERTVPKPSSGKPAPDIVPHDVVHIVGRLFGEDELDKIDAMRRAGKTTTTGDPGGYAEVAYHQATDNSCAVAAQVQVMRRQGLLARGQNPQKQELAIDAEAESRGFKVKGGGTFNEFGGEMLIAKGMTVTKNTRAKWSDLEAPLRSGKTLIVSVDARILWDLPVKNLLAHAILLTGAEIEKKSGKILGVYYNDSGDDPPHAGRFLTVDKFKKMWRNAYAEIE